MSYRKETILDVAANTTGDPYSVQRMNKFLLIVTLTGTVTCTIEGRQEAGDWRTIQALTADGEVNVDNHGFYQVRAVSSGMSAATAVVELSGRE